ncbi:shikimate dehydrogenase [Nocardioides lentus]|uniref:Shikimate dehydrogenase n=1 Tax=Nocardioides lentus TaxID=338077 RepID=A0ABN2PUW7_9ACTN
MAPTPPRCAVVGDPVDHSLSPVLHGAAYAALGLEGTYGVQRVAAGGLAAFVDTLAAPWRGLSVTMPLKREAHALADDLDEAAARAGGVNTLVLERTATGVVRHGHNTDVPGAAAALAEQAVRPRVVTVLGGGATAASVALAVGDLGAERVRLLVRDPARAGAAVAALARHPDRPAVEVAGLEPSSVVGDLVVSTVPAEAQHPALVAACLASVGAGGAVFDVVYDPWPTPLAAAAVSGGVTLVGGLDLLVHQAALQLLLLRGRHGPVEVMRSAGLAELARRSAG